MAKPKYGDEVQLHYPEHQRNDPFHGKTGRVIGEEKMGKGKDNHYYRVRLQEPVEFDGQKVSDDLWTSDYLRHGKERLSKAVKHLEKNHKE